MTAAVGLACLVVGLGAALFAIGAGVYAGYFVMPPKIPLDDWGAPLAALSNR